MKYKNIKALFFDVGGVLLSNGWDTTSRKKAAKEFELDYDEIEKLHNIHFSIYEIGAYTLNEYLNKVIFNKKRNFTKREFEDFMFAQTTELPDTLAWLKQWKQQVSFPVFALNNEGKELNDYRVEKFQLYQLFDGFISSGSIGLRKPNPKIYQLALSIAHVKPKECMYFDDREYLVAAAHNLGIHALLYKDFETTKNILVSINQ